MKSSAGRWLPTGALPVNATGGVMGGHPIAATGVGRSWSFYLEATGRPRGRDSGPDGGYALAFNVGGPLTYNGVTLLSAFRRE
jgi:acetyl-CoA acetyltransferase